MGVIARNSTIFNDENRVWRWSGKECLMPNLAKLRKFMIVLNIFDDGVGVSIIWNAIVAVITNRDVESGVGNISDGSLANFCHGKKP